MSFEVVSGSYGANYPAIAKDRNHVYVDGKISDQNWNLLIVIEEISFEISR